MVVSQLKEDLSRRVAAVDAELAKAEPAKAARTASVDQAAAALDAARGRQNNKAQAFRDSQAVRQATQEDFDGKCQSLQELAREQKRHKKDLEKMTAKLETYREGTLATYAALRNRTRPAEPEPETIPAGTVERLEDGEASTVPAMA